MDFIECEINKKGSNDKKIILVTINPPESPTISTNQPKIGAYITINMVCNCDSVERPLAIILLDIISLK